MAPSTNLATMAKCDIHRMGHDLVFNARDWDAVASLLADEFELIDHPQGLTHRTEDTLRASTEEFWAAFPDIAIEAAEYWDAGECTVARFFVRGTQNGPMGPFPASGRSFVGAMVEIAWYDQDGRITRLEQVYDQLGMLAQLGHVPTPEVP